MQHYMMLSSYISIIYVIAFLVKDRKTTELLTPIIWFACIIGLVIFAYNRFVYNAVLHSEIFLFLTGIITDIPLVIFKLILIYMLVSLNQKITMKGIALALIIIATYVSFIDVKELYTAKKVDDDE